MGTLKPSGFFMASINIIWTILLMEEMGIIASLSYFDFEAIKSFNNYPAAS